MSDGPRVTDFAASLVRSSQWHVCSRSGAGPTPAFRIVVKQPPLRICRGRAVWLMVCLARLPPSADKAALGWGPWPSGRGSWSPAVRPQPCSPWWRGPKTRDRCTHHEGLEAGVQCVPFQGSRSQKYRRMHYANVDLPCFGPLAPPPLCYYHPPFHAKLGTPTLG